MVKDVDLRSDLSSHPSDLNGPEKGNGPHSFLGLEKDMVSGPNLLFVWSSRISKRKKAKVTPPNGPPMTNHHPQQSAKAHFGRSSRREFLTDMFFHEGQG